MQAWLTMRAWQRLQPRQRWVLVGFVVALLAGLLVCGGLAATTWTGTWDVDRRLAALGAIFAAGALWVAIVAGVVAVLADALASERPHLRVELRMPHSEPDRPTLCFDPVEASDEHLVDREQLLDGIRPP